ncbi:uncharacterized protein A4U43_C04F4140 [Asparagus officinalis]|uniref:F-box domain-containing protein n=1 Tax=Asparagus officinalis TaxID=4686 RepID=A0A5P1EY70_ASPOF|nr:uncharacterized protein A4U43_C04F4140 [Asparagus officinalis]
MDLSDELLLEILRFLPRKSLLRFRDPASQEDSVYSSRLGISRGCLRYASISKKVLRVWALGNYDSDSWVLKRNVTLEDGEVWIKAFHLDLDVIFLELITRETLLIVSSDDC